MTQNAAVADLLEEMADRLEAMDVEYKPRAYRRAAENIRGHPADIAGLAREGEAAVQEIEGVGDAIAEKVVEYVETGEIEELADLREELPADIEVLTRVEGVGPKTVGDLYRELGVETLDDLEAAAEAGEIQTVKGFGPKTEQNILEGIDFARESHGRELLGEGRPLADRVINHLEAASSVERAEAAGSLRRWRPTIGDVDVLVSSDEPETVFDAFTSWDGTDRVIEAGEAKASVRADGLRVDLRVVDPDEFGAALQYFTGSRDHNVRVRNRAIERGLTMNEYGVFDISELSEEERDEAGPRAGERVAGESERGMYAAVDLPWMPPELREDRGEVDAAAAGDLPDLVEQPDVRGDLHLHSEWSDGNNTIAEMAEGAAAFGHEYIAITDHATGPGMVGGVGLDDEELREQIAEVREVAGDADVDVFTGVEANIDAEGGLSVGDDVLDELDCVVASPHAALDGDGTDRVVAAIEHPATDIVGHPTGRQLNQRSGLDLDFETVGTAAAEHDVALEINANPRRLDLRGAAVKEVVEQGATIAIDTDAHRPESYAYIRYGVHTARRGWAEPADVLNTQPASGIRQFLGL
ncbi:DNA polymerase/3'-5' exonuclease PolX [Haloglomus halophilum]|uniref:DNA polymerase/3'-5' exonuclease PolX n=1 Tax=Haloglomus halophilum TaxID=2962672 RepID=UPI0020C95FC8|nr:DNA polymerase/3'-5' exonuclease PolX [Haloglomus halophilum]